MDMREYWLGLKFMFSYFTILPVRFAKEDDLSRPGVLAAMLYFFPLGGAVIAGLSVGVFGQFHSVGWLAAVVAAVAYPVLYGFLHTEAVMDVADAVYAAHSGKDPYAIIKDPTVGAMGVFYGVSAMLLKVAAIVYLLLGDMGMVVVMAAMISRMVLVVLFKLHDFRSTFAASLKKALSGHGWWIALAVYALIGTVLAGDFVFWFLFGVLVGTAVSYGIKARIGFVNGDALGATLEGVEIVVLVGMAIGG